MNIGIAGAGIMGRLLAFALVNEGYQVDLYEQGDESSTLSCSMAAAGLLTPFAELEKSELQLFELGNEALLQHWPKILQCLDEEIYFQIAGSLILSHPQDRANWHYFIEHIRTKLQAKPELMNAIQKLGANELFELEPELTKFAEAYYFCGEGQLDNQALMLSLGSYLHKNQVVWHYNTPIDKVAPSYLQSHDKVMTFDLVIDCRGLGAKSLFPNLQGVRGEIIWLHAPQVRINRPVRFIHPRYSLYIVPRPGNQFLLGASEIHSEDRTDISVKTTLELLSAAYYVHPGFAEARITKTITQCRPTLPHYRPSIKYTKGLIAVNGLYRHGFLIAPTLVNEVMQFLQKGFSSLDYPELWERYYDPCEIQ